MVADHSPDGPGIRTLAAQIAERLQARVVEVNASMNEAIEDEVEYLSDPGLASMLHASVEGNIATILHMLANDISLENVQPITVATEYALRLAQKGVPSSSLRRAYHIGSNDLLAFMFDEVEALDCAPDLKLRLLHHLAGWMHKYVDWITRVVLEAHENERRYLVERSESATATLVRRVLGRQEVDSTEFAGVTGHRLDQQHLGAILWIHGASPGVDHTDRLRVLAGELAKVIGTTREPLFTAAERSRAWVWFGRDTDTPSPDPALLRAAVDRVPGGRVAVGSVAGGAAGFRRTHEEAGAIQGVGGVSTSPAARALGHGEDGVAVVAVLARDLPATRRWVHQVLGALAVDTEPASRLRATLRVFLSTGSSYVETAERLVLHRNTVKYRIGKAEELLGRPLDAGRLDVELALHVCHLLGSATLVASPR
jgi:hypothetical protein